MGNEMLHSWARREQQKKEEEYTAKAGVNRKEKKRFTGTPESGKSKLYNRFLRKADEGRRFGRFRNQHKWNAVAVRKGCNKQSRTLVRTSRSWEPRQSCGNTTGLKFP